MKRRSMAHDTRHTRSNSFTNDDKTVFRTKMMDKCNTLSTGGETFCLSICIPYTHIHPFHIELLFLYLVYLSILRLSVYIKIY